MKGNQMRKIVSEVSMKKFTALPLYENKLEAASGKCELCFNVTVQ